MLKAAVYARFSSDLQRKTSIEDQIQVCRIAAPRLGCLVIESELYHDEELSGATGYRAGYQALLLAAKARRFDAILVESQDRLWRNQGEMHQALERLTFWNVRVFSVATGSDLTDRTGRLVASVMGWKDEAFLADLRDKTRRGMQGQLLRGLSTGGRAYGYRSELVHDANGSVVGYRGVIEPTEAAVVRRIFELYKEGMAPKTIARRLNTQSVPPPRAARGRRILGWIWTTINGSPKKAIGILNNPLYAGQAVWNRSQKIRDPDKGKRVMRARPPDEWVWTEAPELRIVPPALWEAVQARRAARRLPSAAITGGNGRSTYYPVFLFAGIAARTTWSKPSAKGFNGMAAQPTQSEHRRSVPMAAWHSMFTRRMKSFGSGKVNLRAPGPSWSMSRRRFVGGSSRLRPKRCLKRPNVGWPSAMRPWRLPITCLKRLSGHHYRSGAILKI
jgi:DNA invertase Pin-like site-specific DNA recombinase